MDTKRLALPAVALAALGVGACTPSSPATTTAPGPVVTQTATQTATTTTTPEPGGHGTSTSTAFPTGSATGSSDAAPTLCDAQNLEVTHASDPDGTGAGKSGVRLTVKNIGSATCQLGEPNGATAIAFVTGPQTVTQIGSLARYQTTPTDRVLILPGTQVSTTLQITRAENLPNCQPQPAWALAVFPSTNHYAVTPVENLTACGNADVVPITAQPWKAA